MNVGRSFMPTAGALALVTLLGPAVTRVAEAGLSGLPEDRYAGLEWTFVRIRYHFITEDLRYRRAFVDEPWYIDAPAAEENLSRRIQAVTSIVVHDPIVLTLDDPALFQHPWIYFVEPGNLKMTDRDVANLREFLLRGGSAMFDDFHGPYEWKNLEDELKRVFPERKIIEIQSPHPIYTCFYKIDEYPQIPGLGSFFSGRTWEKGGFIPHLRAILDDDGRPMVLINWNTDMGDGVEWSNAAEYPGYIKYTAQAYRMFINEILYALTH